MTSPDYIVGIDLGTSNCAMAFVQPERGGPDAPVLDFPIPQLHRAGELRSQPLLPSALYVPGEHELPREAIQLPWPGQPSLVVGEFARWQGSRVPGRLVSSAKSWLCHPGVDRSAPILPWGAPPEVPKLSPVEASARLLRHMIQAWNSQHPNHPLAEQEVVITVPASFDEVARALTADAARRAGFEKFRLVEEPQAAFYDFTARHRKDLGDVLQDFRLVLVVDVGGGTSDFTLVQVGVSPEGPVLRRIAVGEHLMLGGDNMDAALARHIEQKIVAGGRKLSASQWNQLVQNARLAKENLLSPAGADSYNLSIASEGSLLLGRSLSAQITRPEVEQLVLDGFFPFCAPDEIPRRGARTAIQELGLPYAPDPAVTRQLAAFLRQHAASGFAALDQPQPGASTAPLPRPDAILLNGGVFNSRKIAGRLLDAVSAWWPSTPRVPLLEHESLELAVAHGAAYYGLVRRGMGRRIGGGAAHAFYVGLGGQAEPGALTALCVIPRGHEEGETVELKDRSFNLTLGQPVQFPLFSTASDRVDRSGDVVPLSEELHPLPPIHTVLKGTGAKSGAVPVHLRATLTEIGTLELFCVSNISNELWRLEFELRGALAAGKHLTVTESMPPQFSQAREGIDRIFGHKPVPKERLGQPAKEIKQLWASLEKSLGPRDSWRVPVLRELWSALLAGAAKRRRSPDHERIFFQLTGFCLRPGFGYPLDEWRCEQTCQLFPDLVQFHKEKPNWKEFWILWRRIAGGLNESRQDDIWAFLKPHLALRLDPLVPKHASKPKGIQPEGLDEMVRTAASLENISPREKSEFGQWLAARLEEPSIPAGGPWIWALGRLGAREPIHGSVHQTIPPALAADWLRLLLRLDLRKIDGAPFAASQLARLTGDRARDIDDELRQETLAALEGANAPLSWRRMVSEVVQLEAEDEARALGDTLPAGLQQA